MKWRLACVCVCAAVFALDVAAGASRRWKSPRCTRCLEP